MLFKIFPMTHGLKFFTEDMPMVVVFFFYLFVSS